MFRLLKLLFFVAGLGAFAWFGLTVPLGERTLFQHFAAIGSSEPSQELLRGAKEKVGEVKSNLFGGEGEAAAPAPAPAPAARAEDKPAGKPSERLTQSDRREMRRMIEASRRQARN